MRYILYKIFKVIDMGGVIVTSITALLNMPESWRSFVSFLPKWITYDWVRLILGLLSLAYIIWVSFKFLYAKKIYKSSKQQNILDIIAKYDQITFDYVYKPHYPKAKTQENQNNLKKDFDILLALKEVMLDNKLKGYLMDIRQRIAIIFHDAMSLEFDENNLKKKRKYGAISNHEYSQEMPKLHDDFLKHKEIIINYLK